MPRSRWFTIVDPDSVLIQRAHDFVSKLNQIGKCRTWVHSEKENASILSETPRDALLRLMGLLEKALVTRTCGSTFREQVDANRGVFSDPTGILQARRVRNEIAHGEVVPEPQARDAKAVLEQAIAEVLRVRTQPPANEKREVDPEPLRETETGTGAGLAPARARVIPQCTWVYFATDSVEDFAATKRIVTRTSMIIRTVYNSVGIAIANTKRLRCGDSILLVHGGGGRGLPYRPMFSCEIAAPEHPVPGFNGFSFVDDRHVGHLENLNYPRDPHFGRYTGISIKASIDLEGISTLVPRPRSQTAIRKWEEVF